MKIKIAPKLPFYIGLIFGVVLFGLVVKELLAAGSAAILAQQDAHLERDWDFKVHLKNIDILLKEAELGAYAYIASGKSDSLPRMEQWKGRCEVEFRALNVLLGDNPAQRINVEKFHVLANRQLTQLENDVAGYTQAKISAVSSSSALPFPLEGSGGDAKAARNLEIAIEAEQSAMIDRREKQIRERYWQTLMFCFIASAVFMALLVLFYRVNQKYFMQLKRSKSELESKNDHLKNDMSLRAEQLTALSHHLLAVSEQEKASLARELHDELGSNLTAIRLDLLAAVERLKQMDPCLAAQLSKTLQLLTKTHDLKRRIIENLRPSTLENLGLAAAARAYGDEVAQRSGLRIEVNMDEDSAGIDSTHSIAMYRIIQESLTNAVKYARAKHVAISLVRSPQGLHLRIADDGVGFAEGVLGKSKSHGIVGMRERATLLGGSFSIHSGGSGQGTRIDVFLPYARN